VLNDLELRELTFDGVTRPVYRIGSGPAVIVMHEAPGLYPEVAQFGRKVAAAGFTAYMPSLIGTPDKPYSNGYAVNTLLRACVAREFTIWATRKNSAITDWLRQLARFAYDEAGGGVGAVGMCLTGGFALAMMVDEVVKAPVLSQPSLPFAVTPAQKRDLGVDDATLERVRERCEAGACVMGLRFTHDPLVPPQRFQRLRDELGDRFIAIEIDSGPGNPHGIPRTAHSVLVYNHVDDRDHPTQQALERVIEFFADRLQ
jgi:dienelactone hydrolase